MVKILIIAAALLLIGAVWVIRVSPWPAVMLLRNAGDGPIDAPEGYEERIKGVKVRYDLTYPSAYGKNKFDLYLPENARNAPLILWVHGGAFVAGDKRGTEIWASLLASYGYAVASMNYEWAPEAVWPAQTVQVTECLEELGRLSEEGAGFGMDRVFLAGDSAGAHIAMQAAEAWFHEELAEKTGIRAPLDKEKNALKGMLLYCGPYDPEAFGRIQDRKLRYFMNKIGQSFIGVRRWKEHPNTAYLNITSWLTEDCPPVYLTDGNSGSFEKQGKNLGEALRRLGVPVTERFFEPEQGEIGHEYQMKLSSPEGQACFADTLRFLDSCLREEHRESKKEILI